MLFDDLKKVSEEMRSKITYLLHWVGLLLEVTPTHYVSRFQHCNRWNLLVSDVHVIAVVVVAVLVVDVVTDVVVIVVAIVDVIVAAVDVRAFSMSRTTRKKPIQGHPRENLLVVWLVVLLVHETAQHR